MSVGKCPLPKVNHPCFSPHLLDPVLSTKPQSSLPSAWKSERPCILSISIRSSKQTLCSGSLHDWSPTWLLDKAVPLLFQFALLSRGDTFLLERYWLVCFYIWVNKERRIKTRGIKMTGKNVLFFVSGLVYRHKLEGNLFPQILHFQPLWQIQSTNSLTSSLVRGHIYPAFASWIALPCIAWRDTTLPDAWNIYMFLTCQCASAWQHRTNLPKIHCLSNYQTINSLQSY